MLKKSICSGKQAIEEITATQKSGSYFQHYPISMAKVSYKSRSCESLTYYITNKQITGNNFYIKHFSKQIQPQIRKNKCIWRTCAFEPQAFDMLTQVSLLLESMNNRWVAVRYRVPVRDLLLVLNLSSNFTCSTCKKEVGESKIFFFFP